MRAELLLVFVDSTVVRPLVIPEKLRRELVVTELDTLLDADGLKVAEDLVDRKDASPDPNWLERADELDSEPVTVPLRLEAPGLRVEFSDVELVVAEIELVALLVPVVVDPVNVSLVALDVLLKVTLLARDVTPAPMLPVDDVPAVDSLKMELDTIPVLDTIRLVPVAERLRDISDVTLDSVLATNVVDVPPNTEPVLPLRDDPVNSTPVEDAV